jgi:hypothetical protein
MRPRPFVRDSKGRGTALGRPHRLPARGVRPAAPEGTAAGPVRGGQPGAVSFIPFFGSALQVTPHFHALVPDGVLVPREGGVHFEGLAPPTQGEVERLLRVVRYRVLRLLERRGTLPAQGPEDALQAYQAHSLQQRLRWTEVDVRPPPRKQPRCAVLEGSRAAPATKRTCSAGGGGFSTENREQVSNSTFAILRRAGE